MRNGTEKKESDAQRDQQSAPMGDHKEDYSRDETEGADEGIF
jgi:hypothetical protein